MILAASLLQKDKECLQLTIFATPHLCEATLAPIVSFSGLFGTNKTLFTSEVFRWKHIRLRLNSSSGFEAILRFVNCSNP
jgi:hypothetical protein